MRLLFCVNFRTWEQWNEFQHEHQVVACESFEQACLLVYALRNKAGEIFDKKYPFGQHPMEGRLFIDEGEFVNELDPLFQVIDGDWRYVVEPMVELDEKEMASFSEHVWPKTKLLAQAQALIDKSNVNDPDQREPLKEAPRCLSEMFEEAPSALSQALQKALSHKKL